MSGRRCCNCRRRGPCCGRGDCRGRGPCPGGGFTLIELMVVVAIVIMAMGIMTPSLLEYFKNQKLKNVRSHFASALGMARLMAITEGSPIRVVFFREGARVYQTKNRMFRREEEFNPEAAPGSLYGITYELRFARKQNAELEAYRQWEAGQLNLSLPPTEPEAGKCSVEDLVAIEFQRDGTVTWLKGENVPTALFQKKPPEDADIMVRQDGNPEVLFIDVRQTGQIRATVDRPAEPIEPRRR